MRNLVFPVHIVPSLNKLYAGNQWVRARYVREAHEAVRYAVMEQLGTEIETFTEPVAITIRIYAVRPRDADNSLKTMLDGLVLVGVLKDDDYRHVPELHVYVKKVGKGDERIEVEIKPVR